MGCRSLNKMSLLHGVFIFFLLTASFALQTRRSLLGVVASKRAAFDTKLPLSTYSPNESQKALLDEDTLWRLNFKLKMEGKKDLEFYLRVRFIEQRGYEPPQGKIFIEDDISGIVKVDDNGYSGIWTLSEDKDDRKDGLWIWGLFEEPKYPYLYFNMDVYNTTILPSGEEEPIFEGEGIPNGRLYMRCSHSRDKERGAILTDVQATWKETEIVSADVLGIVKFDAGEFRDAGSIDILPQFNPSLIKEKNTSSPPP